MKSTSFSKLYSIFTIILALCSSTIVHAQDMNASFTDPAWTGEAVPEGQQCQRFGGENPRSPSLKITNVPEGADAIVLEFSDRTYEQMNNGGHGKVGYRISAGEGEVTVPSVPGHTMDLPEGFFVVQAHQAPNWDKAGAYLPPCSGGRGNEYGIDIKAVKLSDGLEVSEVLAETSIGMGSY